MGYKHSYDLLKAYNEIRGAVRECSDPRNDGFVSWGVKQDLYQVLWFLESELKKCPEFAPEKDWLREQEKNRVIKILKENK